MTDHDKIKCIVDIQYTPLPFRQIDDILDDLNTTYTLTVRSPKIKSSEIEKILSGRNGFRKNSPDNIYLKRLLYRISNRDQITFF